MSLDSEFKTTSPGSGLASNLPTNAWIGAWPVAKVGGF